MKVKLAGALASLLFAGTVNANVIADLEDVTNGGGFFAQVIFDDIATDVVKVTADISDPINVGLTQGDILGLGFQIGDESLIPLLIANNGNESPTGIITGTTCQSANSCDLFNGGAGSPGKNFDIVVNLGTNGSADGFIQTLSFEMSGAGLTASLFADQSVGMRVQSIEGGSFAFGSSKLVGDGPDTPTDPDNPVPVPAPLTLFGAGLIAFALSRRRKV